MTKYYLFLLITIILNTSANLLLKYGATHGLNQIPSPFSINNLLIFFKSLLQPSIVAGTSLFAIGLIFWILALSKIEVSIAAPLMAMSYFLIALFGYIFLGESITLYKIVGILLIWLGVFFLVGKSSF